MTKLIKYHFIFALFFSFFIDLDAQNKDQICLNRSASFLYQPYPSRADKPLRINLKEWKLQRGDTLRLNVRESSFSPIIGVFSKDSLLLSHDHQHRVPNAIDYIKEIYTPKSLFSKELTDIEEDFCFDNREVIVPKEANYLFLGNGNSNFDLFNDSICFNLSSTKRSWQSRIKTITSVKVAKCRTKILIWDDSNEDGDVVTLYLNGEIVVNQYMVSNKQHKIRLELRRGKNEFWIYAENVGKLGDNTAVVQIEGKPYRKVIHVNSKAGTAKSIIIICEE